MKPSVIKCLLIIYKFISISSYYPNIISNAIPSQTEKSYDLTKSCPCVLTMNVCNYGCLCDTDCQVYIIYIKVNFFKKENLEKNWWYAPGPGFIKLPRNVMYPFRIGTTTYKKSSSN